MRPSTLSRRGFLRALGITATTVLLGDVVKVEAAPAAKLITVPVNPESAFTVYSWEVKMAGKVIASGGPSKLSVGESLEIVGPEGGWYTIHGMYVPPSDEALRNVHIGFTESTT